jgi:hypothetical protein
METDSFETDLRQTLARRAAEVPGEAVERLQRRRYRPRSPGQARMAIAGLTGAAAAAAVLGIALSQPAGHPSSALNSHPSSALNSHQSSAPVKTQLAAWTVTKQADGTVTISIRELSDPAALQAKIRAAGIPANVSSTPNTACTQYNLSGAAARGSLRDHVGQTTATTFVIRSSSLPSGAGLQLSVLGHLVLGRWVNLSPQCTGS